MDLCGKLGVQKFSRLVSWSHAKSFLNQVFLAWWRCYKRPSGLKKLIKTNLLGAKKNQNRLQIFSILLK